MSDDILADWKKSKFILASRHLTRHLTETDKHLIVLTDIKYWAEHADELKEWCDRTQGVRTQGMTVEISDDKTLTHFILKWS